MKILIADDDSMSRRLLEMRLRKHGHELVLVENGSEAWEELERDAEISIAILDWMMPEMTGPEVCRRVRRRGDVQPIYLILLTSRVGQEDLVTGLDAGADDYITKPFDFEELRARVRVGVRMVRLQQSLAARVSQLEEALANVRVLQGLLPICLYCKKIRDDQNYWQQVDKYIGDHSQARFSHGVCPDCYERVVKPEIGQYLKNGNSDST
jgi:DNA-binding response OmpR family regulator